MQALGIDNNEGLFLLMARAHLPMPPLPESIVSRMVDDLRLERAAQVVHDIERKAILAEGISRRFAFRPTWKRLRGLRID